MFRPIESEQKYLMDYDGYCPVLHTDMSLLSYALLPKFVYEVTGDFIHINSTLVLPAFPGYLWIFGLLFAMHQGDIEEKSKESSYKWTGENSVLVY